MSNFGTGPKVKNRAKTFVGALIAHANYELEVNSNGFKASWCRDKDDLYVVGTVQKFKFLIRRYSPDSIDIKEDQIKEVLRALENLNFLPYLESNQGSHIWKFNLHFDSREKQRNLNWLDNEWDIRKREKKEREVLRDEHAKPVSDSTPQSDSFPPYVEHPLLEDKKQIVQQPGGLLRIKGPLKKGKTCSMRKVLEDAVEANCRVVYLNLSASPTEEDFESLEKFLLWFCNAATEELEFSNLVNDYWRRASTGCKITFMKYFENFILSDKRDLVIAIDELEKVYSYPNIANEFLPMIRARHSEGKLDSTSPWRKLKQVIAYTENYTNIPIKQSPFNAGDEIDLSEFEYDFNRAQIFDLAHKYSLRWNVEQVDLLMNMVGGHPYLVHEAIKKASTGQDIEKILKKAPTINGIYQGFFEEYRQKLSSFPELESTFRQVVLSSPAELKSLDIDQVLRLKNLGLIKFDENVQNCEPRYELYYLYFRRIYQ